MGTIGKRQEKKTSLKRQSFKRGSSTINAKFRNSYGSITCIRSYGSNLSLLP